MNAEHFGLFSEELLVGFNGDFLKLRVGAHLPGWVAVVLYDFCTCQLECRLDGIGHIAEIAHDIGALTGYDGNLVFCALDTCHIAGCLYHPCEGFVLTHGEYSVVECLDC